MKAETAFAGAIVVDSYPFSMGGTLEQAKALKATGVDALAGYLNVINPTRLGYLFEAGLAFVPVSLGGDALKPERITTGVHALGLHNAPNGTVFLDIEGPGVFKMKPIDLINQINQSASQGIRNLGLMPGVYFAPPQPLTSKEMFERLVAVRYWKGMGSIRDRNNDLAEPACGWCMTQMYHGKRDASGMLWRDLDPTSQGRVFKDTGVFVDPNMVGADFQGRFLNWFVG